MCMHANHNTCVIVTTDMYMDVSPRDWRDGRLTLNNVQKRQKGEKGDAVGGLNS